MIAEELGARVFRARWAIEDRMRDLLWCDRPGYLSRAAPEGGVERLEDRGPEPAPVHPRTPMLGLLADRPEKSPAFAAAGFYGIQAEVLPPAGAAELFGRAAQGRWPLVALALEERRLEPALEAAAAFLAGGGTVLVEVPGPLQDGIGLPGGRKVATREMSTGRGRLRFPGRRADFAHEFAGLELSGVRIPFALAPLEGAAALAVAGGPQGPLPVVLELPAGAGCLVVAAGAHLEGRLCDAFLPSGALATLPALMLVRSLYGVAAWHAPFQLANFTIDDPALRPGRLGADFGRLAAVAAGGGFHVTVATIPRELPLADPATIERLMAAGSRVTACYHGNDHSGYEFFLPGARRLRYRGRPLPAQAAALAEANRRGWEFSRRAGARLDRVMVFPHGIGPAAGLDQLRSQGFLATCNFSDRHPLGGEEPSAPDLGMRPADVYPEWAGFPLLWRRGLPDPAWIFDLFAGRPVMTFGHPRVPGLLDRFGARALAVNQAGAGAVCWAGLEAVARHAWLQRARGPASWEILMFGNQACLHNPGTEPRALCVTRPHHPPGTWLSAARGAAAPGDPLLLTLAPGATAEVILDARDRLPLPGRDGCPLAPLTDPGGGRDLAAAAPKSPADSGVAHP